MSLNNVSNPEKNVVELEFSISKEIFDAAVLKVYKKNVSKMNVPGFRKGKAPKSIIEKMYGKGVFYEDALNDILPEAYEEALKESGATAVSRPEFDVVSIDDEGVSMKAKFFIKPDVEIADYIGIEAERTVEPVKDEDVDADIKRVQERNSRMIDVADRPAQLDDTVVIDYCGTVDGVEFEGGKAEKHNLKLGSNQFIPGFEDQIIGKNIGDEFDVNVTFPEEYHAEDLKGKAAVFAVKLHEIKYTELPALDDDFAKDVSEFDTFDEYKADVKAKIAKRNEDMADSAVEGKILDTLVDKLEADIPEAMFENEVENQLRDYDNRLRMQGMSLDMYFKYTGLDLETMRGQFRPQAERQVKVRLALEKIAENEKIEVTEEDLSEEYDRIAKAYSMELDKVKESLPSDTLSEDVKVQKALKFIKDNAKITDVEKATAAEDAAKTE